MNVGDTVTVRVHDGRDCAATVVATYEGEPDVLDVQVGALKPLKRLARAADIGNPTPFTWRPIA